MSFDENNPFAPSESGFNGQAAGRVDNRLPVSMDPGEIFERCVDILKENPGVVIGAILLPLVPAFALAAADATLTILAGSDENFKLVAQVGSLVTNILSWAMTLLFTLGQTRIFMNLARGQHTEIGMLVGEARNMLSGFAVQLLMIFGILIGFLLLIVPGFIISMGLQFSLYTLLDRDSGPIDALQQSWELTDGYKMTIFFVNLLLGLGLFLLTCVTLGLGYLVAVPVLALAQGVMYHALTHLKGNAGGASTVW
jgi:uncharacterized membrane protein